MTPDRPDLPTVFVVDDDEDVRRSLERLLRAAGLQSRLFASPQQFLEQARDVPGCLVLDLRMPQMSGLELQARLAKSGLHFPVIFLTGHGDVPTTVRAMKSGAADFLTKPYRSKDLLAAVQAALERDRTRRQIQLERADLRRRAASLTPREKEVFRMVVSGAANKVIADQLGIAERTVKVHRDRVMEKMRVVSVAELTRLAERGALEPPAS
jgi:FixJ family two-component response regulator